MSEEAERGQPDDQLSNAREMRVPVTHLINATLDGRCDHRSVVADDDLHAHALETIADADLILFGSGTYQLLAPYWSRAAEEKSGTAVVNEFAAVFAAKPKLLFSATAQPWPAWNTTVDTTDPRLRVPELLSAGKERLVVQASPQLARSLRRAGLVDFLRLLLQPMVAGVGPALFGPDERYEDLILRSARVTGSGAAALDYAFPSRTEPPKRDGSR